MVTQSNVAYAAFIITKNNFVAATPEGRATMAETREVKATMRNVMDLYSLRYILDKKVPPVDPAAIVTITETEKMDTVNKIKSMFKNISSSAEGVPAYITTIVGDLREILALLPPRPQ